MSGHGGSVKSSSVWFSSAIVAGRPASAAGRVRLWLLALSLCLLCVSEPGACAGALCADTARVAAGDTLKVAVYIEGQGEIDAFGFDLYYDAAKLAYLSVQPSHLTLGWDYLDGRSDSSRVRVGGFDPVPISAGVSDTLCYVCFEVLGGAAVSLSLASCVDDLSCTGASVCAIPSALLSSRRLTWGAVKAIYRE